MRHVKLDALALRARLASIEIIERDKGALEHNWLTSLLADKGEAQLHMCAPFMPEAGIVGSARSEQIDHAKRS